MKVLYTSVEIGTEGAKVHIESFISAFRNIGNDVVENRIHLDPFLDDKSKWSLLKRIWIKSYWIKKNLIYFFSSCRLIFKNKPDLLLYRYLQNQHFFISVFVLSLVYPIVLEINAVKSIEDPRSVGKISNFIDKLTIKCAKKCFVVSQRVKDHLVDYLDVPQNKITVVANGVDVHRFNANISIDRSKDKLNLAGRFVIGFVGSFKPWHGIENLIPLMKALVADYPDLILLVVGDAPERAAYVEKVKDAGLSKYFMFAGYVQHEEIPNYIAAMDIALSPHKHDYFNKSGGFHGSPLKIFEYMAMRKAIIAAPLGQIKDLIIPGITGEQIYAEETENLKNAVIKMYENEEYRTLLGVNARQLVEDKYTWKINAEKVQEICESALI